MTYIDLIGWVAAGFTLSAFAMKTMLPFRATAIGSNLSFIVYGALTGVYPMMFLHLVLFPFNVFRLYQLLAASREVRKARMEDGLPDGILAYLKPVVIGNDGWIFRKGDKADRIYYIKSGTVVLTEIGKQLGAGEIFGELAFFNLSGQRTMSAKCDGHCEVLAISEDSFTRLFFQNPAFGMFVLKMMARRFEDQENRFLAGK